MNDVKYRNLLETLREKILRGAFAAGSRVPSMRALIGRYGVSKTTVQHAMDELAHQGLVTRKQGRGTFVSRSGAARKIGLIVPGLAVTDYYLPIAREINELAHRERYALYFREVFAADRAARVRQVRELAAQLVRERVAGVIFEPLAGPSGTEANAHILRVLDRARIPVVLLDCDIVPFPDRSGHDVVGSDDMGAGATLARHLLDCGARRIHFLASASAPTTFENRLFGLRAAVREWGRKGETVVLRADPGDVAALRRHLKRHGRPDAFVCGNDAHAAEFARTLGTAGLAVPKDLLLAGFADLPIASLMTPRLTTVRQCREEMGRLAFRRLLERIANPALPVNEILFPAQLVVRESTTRPSGGTSATVRRTR